MTTTPRDASEARQSGLTRIGEWGWYDSREGAIWCRPEDVDAVAAAYEAADENDEGPDWLADIEAAGGLWVPDEVRP